MDVTKLFGLVVSIDEIVRDVAVDDSVTLVPAMKLLDPSGVYPRALVMLSAFKAAELSGV